MRVKSIYSSWLEKNGYRFDCNPYMSGAIEAKVTLDELSFNKESLSSLTVGHNGGIYNGPKFSRTWVRTTEFGVPFLGSASMLYADLTNLPLLRKKDAISNKLSYLEVKEGMTLLSCSGTIGRMVYVRADMEGMWSSQHIMKIAPDKGKILPGYLFAYLSSKYGLPLVVSGTYGAIIQHLEPEHIESLPVPRLENDIEEKIHNLVADAATVRCDSSEFIQEAIEEYERAVCSSGKLDRKRPIPFSASTVSSRDVVKRFDGAFHGEYHREVRKFLLKSQCTLRSVSYFAESIYEPPRVKRIPVKDGQGVKFFGTSALRWSVPVCSYYVSRKQKSLDMFIVTDRTILIPRSGQVSGIIGHPMMPIGDVLGSAVSEDAIRVRCKSAEVAGFLYVAMSSELGKRQLKSRAYGSSIPHLDVAQIGEVKVPELEIKKMEEIGRKVSDAFWLLSQAIRFEDEARKLLEATIHTS